jgi:hypothetical protein
MSNYCNILDVLSDKGYDKLVVLMTKHCMSSILTKKMNKKRGRTLIVPPVKDISKLDNKDGIKAHIFNMTCDLGKLKDKSKVHSMNTTYDVEVKGKTVKIGGATVKLLAEANNGVILQASGVLKGTKKEAPKKSSKGTKKEAPKKSSKGGANMRLLGGTGFKAMQYVEHPILTDDIPFSVSLSGLSGIDLRWNILEHYRRKWPAELWSPMEDYNFYSWAYSSLVLYLRDRMSDFFSVYEPFVNPIVGLEHLLQYRLVNSNKYLVSDSILHDWIASPYWLASDPILIKEANLYTLGGGAKEAEMDGGTIPIIMRSSNIINSFLGPNITAMIAMMDNPEVTEQQKRAYIIDNYMAIESDDKFRSSKSRKLYRKLDSDLYIATLGTHILAYLTEQSTKLMLTPAMGGGGGDSIVMNPYNTAFHETLCAFGSLGPRNVVNTFLQPSLTSNYMFPLSVVKKFCTSPYCLYVAGLKHPLHKTTLKSPYIKRTTYTDFGKPTESTTESTSPPNPFGSPSGPSGPSGPPNPFGTSTGTSTSPPVSWDNTNYGAWDASGI